MRIFIVLASATLLAVLPKASIAQSDTELRVGQIIGNEVGQIINGWRHIGGSLYALRTFKDRITYETDECCIATFKKGNVYLFAQTVPIARNPSGGVEAERIIQIKKYAVPVNEVSTDCNLMWVRPIASFYNSTTKIVRSFIFNGTEFEEVRWFEISSYCDHGD